MWPLYSPLPSYLQPLSKPWRPRICFPFPFRHFTNVIEIESYSLKPLWIGNFVLRVDPLLVFCLCFLRLSGVYSAYILFNDETDLGRVYTWILDLILLHFSCFQHFLFRCPVTLLIWTLSICVPEWMLGGWMMVEEHPWAKKPQTCSYLTLFSDFYLSLFIFQCFQIFAFNNFSSLMIFCGRNCLTSLFSAIPGNSLYYSLTAAGAGVEISPVNMYLFSIPTNFQKRH